MNIKTIHRQLDKSPLFKRFVVGGGWLLGGGGIAAALNALTTFSLAAYLGIDQFGIYALIISTVTLVAGVLTLRTTEAVTKFLIDLLQDDKKEKSVALVKLSLLIDFLMSLLVTVVLFFSARLIVPAVFGTAEYLQWFQLYALTPVFVCCYATSLSVLRAGNRFAVISGIDVVQNSIKCIGTLSLIFISASWQQILIWTIFVAMFRGAALMWSVFYGLKHLSLTMNIYNRVNLNTSELKEVVKLMLTTSGVSIIKTIHTQADTVLVGMILGPASSGAYKLARNIIQLLAFPTNALFQVSFPEFTRLLKDGETARFNNVMTNLLRATFFLCVIYCFGMWFIAPYLLPVFIGDSYQQTIDLLPILVIGLSLVLLSQYWHAALVAVNKAGQVAFSMATALIVQVSMNLFLLEYYGIEMAAASYLSYCLLRAIFLRARFVKYVTKSFRQDYFK